MSDQEPTEPAPKPQSPEDFETAAGEKSTSLGREVIDMLKHNKKWWLLPIIILLLLIGIIIVLGGTAAAPFIYTLF